MAIDTALVICPDPEAAPWIERRLAGLGIGERLLLALGTEGIERVAFAGPGRAPSSPRASVSVVPPEEAAAGAADGEILLVPADLVFDRTMISTGGDLPSDLPMERIPASGWEEVAADAARALERLGPGRADGGRGFAIRVVDRKTARLAERSLLLSMRKPVDGIVSRLLNRRISLFISRYLVRTGLTPNQITAAIMLVGVASAVMAAVAEPWWALALAGLLYQGQSILDGCDGEVARLTYRFSTTGQWLDTIGDDLTNYLFYLGLAVGQARVRGDDTIIYAIGAITFLAQCVTSAVMYQRLYKMGTGDLLALPDTVTASGRTRIARWLTKAGRILTKRDMFVFVIATLTVAQLPFAAFATMTAGTYPGAAGVILNEIRISRRERAGREGSP